LPAADTAVGQDDLDAAKHVDHRGRSTGATGFVIVHHDDHDAKLDRLEYDDDHAVIGFGPGDVVQHDQLAVGYDVFFIGDDTRFAAPKNQLASLTSVVDGRVPQRARRDRIAGDSCRLDEASACAEATEGETGTSGELRKHRRTCVHWIRVRGCARAQPRHHRPLRLNALASPLLPAGLARFEYGSLPWRH
jgi:hypothetical protein